MSDEAENIQESTPNEGGEDINREEILAKYTSPEEEKAKAKGWEPPELHGEGGVSAEVFNMRGEWIAKDMTRQKEIKSLKKQLEISTKMQKEIYEQGRKQALAELQKQRATAINEADGDRVIEIEAKMEELKKPSEIDSIMEEESDDESKAEQGNISPYYTESWLPKNPWYVQNTELRKIADAIGRGAAQDPNITSEEDFYNFVDKAMEPHLRAKKVKGNTTVTTTNTRTNPNNGSGSKKKVSAADLSYAERQAGERMVGAGIFKDLDAYAVSLAKVSK